MAASTKFVQRVANAFRVNGGHDSVTIHGLNIGAVWPSPRAGFTLQAWTTDLHATFVKPAGGKGDTVRVYADLISLGRVMATTRIEVRHPVTDALLAFGSHTKFVGKIHSHPENVEFDPEGETVVKGKPIEEWPDH